MIRVIATFEILVSSFQFESVREFRALLSVSHATQSREEATVVERLEVGMVRRYSALVEEFDWSRVGERV